MGIKLFNKKNGKCYQENVNDKPENSDAKVTEAMLSNEDPEEAKEGTTIRVLWIPKTANTYCWVQGTVTKTSVSEKKNKNGIFKTNEVTIENVILVRCLGEEYCGVLPPRIQVELSVKQNWAMGPEPDLSFEEENEIIRIDTDAIPREIPWKNDDLENETEVKGAAGGINAFKKSNSNNGDEKDLLHSEDESSIDETIKRAHEEKEARTLREEDSNEEVTKEKVVDILKRMKEAARENKTDDNITKYVKEACDKALIGMDNAFIAGVLSTPTGEAREDSEEYAQEKTFQRRREAAYEALKQLDIAKKNIEILEKEEYGKMNMFLGADEETFFDTKRLLSFIKASSIQTMKKARNLYKSLGAVRRTSSKLKQPSAKVKFAKESIENIIAPSAPLEEDIEQQNDKPPKYDSIHKGTGQFQGVMQAPGSISYDRSMLQFPPYGWQQQTGAHQIQGYTANMEEMDEEWINTQVNNTKTLLLNRGFSRNIWKYFLTIPREWKEDDLDPSGVHNGVIAVLTSRGNVNPWWIPATQTGEKVKLSTSFKKVRQVLEEVERFKKESMPDDGQLNAEYNRAEKKANKLHEKLQEASNELSELASCADQTNHEFYDFILDFVDKVKINDDARKKAEEMKELLSSKGIVTQQTNVSSDYLKTQLPTFDGESSLSILEAMDTWKRIFKNAGVHPQMWGSWILEKIKEPATSSISPSTKRDQVFSDICEELKKKYSGAVEVAHNLMETHLKIGKIPDPSNHPDAALKALIAHYECMEHASRYIELSGNISIEGEILTGTYLKKLLSFIPLRVRQDHDEFDDAETTTERRRGQYKKIKEWILKIRKKLLSSGTNMEGDDTDKITMVTFNKQASNNTGNSNRNNDYNYGRNSRPRDNKQERRRERQDSPKIPLTECTFCELIRNKAISQKYLDLSFEERHQQTQGKYIYPNQCLAWLRLSMEEREIALDKNTIKCRICLRHFKLDENRGDVCKRKHIENTESNGSCWKRGCDYNATMCRDHHKLNKDRHYLLRKGMDWANRIDPQPVKNHMSFLMQVGKDTEAISEEVQEDLNTVRKEIQINTEQDLVEVLDNINQQNTTLVVVEDRRNNKAQFDLAFTNIDGEKVLTTFDTCSNVTLILEELIRDKRIKVLHTEESSNIEGIGGAAKGKIVEFEISNRFGKRIRIKASVVDKIAFVPPLKRENYKELIDASVKEVRKEKGFENATADNFQMVPGGKIELLLGLDAGSDFFPEEISNFKSGLKVSQYRMNMFDPKRTLGFSGSFPEKYAPMYLPEDHPKALILQEDPKIDNASVFQITASATMIR